MIKPLVNYTAQKKVCLICIYFNILWRYFSYFMYQGVIFAALQLCFLAAIVSPRPSTLNSMHVQQSTKDSLSWLWKLSIFNSTNNASEEVADHKGTNTIEPRTPRLCSGTSSLIYSLRRARRDAPGPCGLPISSRLSPNNIIVVRCHTHTLVGCSRRYNGECRPVRCRDGSDLLTVGCECKTSTNPAIKVCSRGLNWKQLIL